MRLLIFVTFCLLLMFSCSKGVDSGSTSQINPDSVLTTELLIDYMTEIFLIEAAIYKAQHDGKNVKDYAVLYYRDFYQRHDISRQKLKMSFEFYITNNKMEEIMQEVVENLSKIDLQTQNVQQNINETDTDKTVRKIPWLENLPID